MDTANYPQRGQVYFLDFKGARGRTMRDRHPALVIQNNTANRYSGIIMIVPLTTNLKVAQLPVGVAVEPPEGGLKRQSAIHCGQIHSVDREEFTPERLSGHLSPVTIQKVNKALKISLDLV